MDYLISIFVVEMMKRGMNMILKAVVLPLLAAAFCSCALGETDVMSSLDEEPVANYQVMGIVSDEAGAPVYGIRVIADYSSLTVYRADTLYTDREAVSPSSCPPRAWRCSV